MRIIMRRVAMILYSKNQSYDDVRRCLLNRMKQFY